MNKATLKRMTRRTEFWIFLVLVIMCIAIQTISGGQLFKSSPMVTIFRSMVVDGMFAMCCLVVMVSGGFDLSFPAVAALAYSLATTICVNMGWCTTNPIAGLVLATVIGFVLGMLNGWIISNFKLNTMIVTLGTSSVFKGFMQGTLESRQLAVIPAGMKSFGTSSLFTATNTQSGLSSRLPAAFLVLVLIVLIAFLILKYTMFGRGIYAIGGNEAAAYNAGFRVKRTKFLLYVFAGVVASIAGMIRVCMMQQCHPTNMLGMEMNIIAGVVLGGTVIGGGRGTLTGCILGTLLIVLVENSMILIGVPVVWKDVFVGLLIVIGTAISAYQVTRSGRSKGNRKQTEEVA